VSPPLPLKIVVTYNSGVIQQIQQEKPRDANNASAMPSGENRDFKLDCC
jgi:hypothetical protein